MPAALDVSGLGGWESIRMLCVEVGVREGARRLGISEDVVRQRSSREGWIRGIRRDQPLPPTMISPTVTGVTTAAEIQRDVLREESRETRFSHARIARRIAKKLEASSDEELLVSVPTVLTAGKHAALVGGWTGSTGERAFRLEVVAGAGAAVRLECGSPEPLPDSDEEP